MPTGMTSDQILKLRDASVPTEVDGTINRIIVKLWEHQITLNWDEFVKFIKPSPVAILKTVEDFIGTFNPKA